MTSLSTESAARPVRAHKDLGAPGVVEVWAVADLKPHPLNPRGEIAPDDPGILELAESIRVNTLMEPLIITRRGLVLAGHRRRVACIVAGVKRVRVIVQESSDEDAVVAMLTENKQREDLNPVQEARGYQVLIERGLSVSEIARRTAVNAARVSLCLDLLKLPPDVQDLIARSELATGCVRALERLPSPAEQSEWARRAVKANWSAKKLAAALDNRLGGPSRRARVDHHAGGERALTREMALASLEAKRGWPFPLAILERALARTPCSCSGVKEDKQELLCADCPMALLLTRLLQEAHDARP